MDSVDKLLKANMEVPVIEKSIMQLIECASDFLFECYTTDNNNGITARQYIYMKYAGDLRDFVFRKL